MLDAAILFLEWVVLVVWGFWFLQSGIEYNDRFDFEGDSKGPR